MNESLEHLRDFQLVSKEITQLSHDAEMLGLDIANQERVVRERERRVEQCHEARLEAAKKADAVQMQIEEAEADKDRLRVQLNTTKSNTEFQKIRKAMASRDADIDRWSDEALTALQQADELREQEQATAAELDAAREELERIRQRVAAELEALKRRIAELAAGRDEIAGQIRPEVLAAYERLVDSRADSALAEVKDRVCQGCFTRITKQTENLLMRGNELVFCHSCGRILMLPDDE